MKYRLTGKFWLWLFKSAFALLPFVLWGPESFATRCASGVYWDATTRQQQTICLYALPSPLVADIRTIGNIVPSNITYQFYVNTVNSNTGGTLLRTFSVNTFIQKESYTPVPIAPGTYYYYCVVTNINGACGHTSYRTGTVQITVTSGAVINTQPSNLPALYCINGTANPLSVMATGVGLTYQWYSNTDSSYTGATPITGATASSYTPSTANTGTLYYFVIIGNSCGIPDTSSISGGITVTSGPSVTSQPVNEMICSGSNATFSVNVSGPPVTYQWQENRGIGWNNLSNGGIYLNVTTSSLTLSGATAAMNGYQYRVIATGTGQCNSGVTSNAATLSFNNIWTGTVSNDWNTAGNWSGNAVPTTACPDVYIPSGTTYSPVITGMVSPITNLNLYSGASLTINGTLILGGTITEGTPNSIIATNGTLVLNGAALQSIPGAAFQNNALSNLEIANSSVAGVSLNGPLDIYESLTYADSGTALTTNGYLALKSSANQTAWVGPLTNNNSISGDVTVERYIATGNTGYPSHGKTWQLLAIPTTGNESIKDAWQEGSTESDLVYTAPGSTGNPVAGYGTMLTSDLGPTDTTQLVPGFDAYTPTGPSIKIFNPAGDFISPASTALPIYNKAGYYVFVRGDRSINNAFETANPTILRTKGALMTPANPPPSDTVAAGTFASIGNPYASAIDVRNITYSGGINGYFYVWDPDLGSGDGYGGYQQLFPALDGSGNYWANPGGDSYGPFETPANYIQSGQAFLVNAPDNDGILSFSENDKASGSALVTKPAGIPSTLSIFRATLSASGQNQSTRLLDGVIVNFNTDYNNKLHSSDARKMLNSSENLAIVNTGVLLSLENRAPVTTGDTLFLNLTNLKQQSYQLDFDIRNLTKGLQGVLLDQYLNTRTVLPDNSKSQFNFTVSGIKASYAPNRFIVVFEEVNPVQLHMRFGNIDALPVGNGAKIGWSVTAENDVISYSVQKSIDSVHFSTFSTQLPVGNNNLSQQYIDLDPLATTGGTRYYRVVANLGNGISISSPITKVVVNSGGTGFSIYPNPVLQQQVHLKIVNQPAGYYKIRILNNVGQVLEEERIFHSGGDATQLIPLEWNLAHGIYRMEIVKPDRASTELQLLY